MDSKTGDERDARITKAEYKAELIKNGLSEQEATRISNSADANKNGQIDFWEYIAQENLSSVKKDGQAVDLKTKDLKAYAKINIDANTADKSQNTGFFKFASEYMNIKDWDMDTQRSLLAFADKNKDGCVSEEELKSVYFMISDFQGRVAQEKLKSNKIKTDFAAAAGEDKAMTKSEFLSYIGGSLTQAQQEKVHTLFLVADANKDYKLSENEFTTLVRALDTNGNGNGKIDLSDVEKADKKGTNDPWSYRSLLSQENRRKASMNSMLNS
ncbi:MAG: EF-hand domain-containing protein [Sphingobacterium sp.]|nr:EF-hand domain-containing protein [Sphingobacterium sp.]